MLITSDHLASCYCLPVKSDDESHKFNNSQSNEILEHFFHAKGYFPTLQGM